MVWALVIGSDVELGYTWPTAMPVGEGDLVNVHWSMRLWTESSVTQVKSGLGLAIWTQQEYATFHLDLDMVKSTSWVL